MLALAEFTVERLGKWSVVLTGDAGPGIEASIYLRPYRSRSIRLYTVNGYTNSDLS